MVKPGLCKLVSFSHSDYLPYIIRIEFYFQSTFTHFEDEETGKVLQSDSAPVTRMAEKTRGQEYRKDIYQIVKFTIGQKGKFNNTCGYVQVNLCQKLFLHQLTHNMTTDWS